MYKVFIHGGSGTTGLRLRSRLEGREDVTLIEIEEAQRKDPNAIRERMAESDVSFFCLPDAAAIEAAELAEAAGCRVIDCSTAHRTSPDWAYGFPELSGEQREKIIAAPRVAGPGCHASGVISLVYPLVRSALLPPDYPLCCTSVTGYSGGGKSMIAEYEADEKPELYFAPRQYGLSQQHKHLPEIRAVCGLAGSPAFMPIVDDFYAGMHVTIPLHTRLLPGKQTAESVHEALKAHYAGSAIVKVEPAPVQEGMLSALTMTGRDDMRICVSGSGGVILLHSLFDNLGKGASGAALQCFNLMVGAGETTGLVLGKDSESV